MSTGSDDTWRTWCPITDTPCTAADPNDPDFTDRALEDQQPGRMAHAVLIVGATPHWLYLVTWARVVRVSMAWWYRYGKEEFVVEHPAWRMAT